MRGRVLVVEDDGQIARLMKLLLNKNFPDVEVITTANGTTAIDLLTNDGPFTLVTTDISIKGPSGTTVLEKIRSGATEKEPRGTSRDVPVGCIATWADEYSGFSFQLSKPFEFDEYLALIRPYLDPAVSA